MITWSQIVELEPKLGKMLTEIQKLPPSMNDADCHFSRWYGFRGNRKGYKQKLTELVGWMIPNKTSELCSHVAYDVAYKKLSDTLPGCSTCKNTNCPSCGY